MQQPIYPALRPIHANISIPGSKHIAHRAILIASLADGVSEISGLPIDDELRIFINALNQLGIVTQLDEKSGSMIIAGGNGKYPKKQAAVWCGNAEAVTRFLIAACASTPGVYYFDGSSSLRKRSITPLLKVLSLQGVQFIPSDTRKMPFTLIGADSMEGGDIHLNDATLSQVISALLMISPYARSPVNFFFRNLQQKSQIDLTYATMAEFGVLVHRVHNGQFMIPVPQKYRARDYLIEPDLSLAAYFFAAAAITGGEITIQPLKRCQSKQSEIKLLALFEKMGCELLDSNEGLTVKGPTQLRGIDATLNEFSDEFLILTALAPFANSPSTISHASNLRRKESERLFAMKTELIKMNISAESGKNWITIMPAQPQAGLVSSHQNYRVGMALAIMGLKIPGMVIDHAQAVIKNCPNFFKSWEQMAKNASNLII